MASLKSGHGIRGGCAQHPQPYSIPQAFSLQKCFRGDGGAAIFLMGFPVDWLLHCTALARTVLC